MNTHVAILSTKGPVFVQELTQEEADVTPTVCLNGTSKQLVSQPVSALYTASETHFSQFLSAIQTGVEPSVSAAHAREVLRVVFAGYQSAQAGGELVKLQPQPGFEAKNGAEQPMGATRVR